MSSRFYKIGTVIGFSIIIAIIVCIVVAKNKDKKVAEIDQSLIMSSTNLIEDDTNKDSKKEEFNVIEEANKTVKSTNNQVEDKNSNKTKEAENKKNQNKTVQKTAKVDNKKEEAEQKQEAPKDPNFKYPVKGEIIQDYAKDKLVYSATLGEWVTHTGIDIKANKTTVVSASADGCVKSIKNDPRYGLTVVIEHNNDFSTVYANLLTAEFVSVGENVKSGQTIGTVGNTASFEILDEPHLHFEILKNNESIDPNMYLKN